MKRLEGNRLVAVLISAGMAATFLAACSIDTEELSQGINELGNAFVTETEATAATTTEEETVVIETGEETETTLETVIETSPTPTNSPTPLPERVDFSDYTDIDLTDNFKVTAEVFGESSHSDDDSFVFATFEGSRLVVVEAENETARDAINLIVDGFYKEAEGVYNNLLAKAKSEYKVTGVVETPYAVNVSFEYSSNGRALSVLMSYTVTGGDMDTKVYDFATFDMLSGHYITPEAISQDPEGLEKAVRNDFADALKKSASEPEAATETPAETTAATTDVSGKTTETTAETTVETAAPEVIPEAYEFEKIYIAPANAETEDARCITVYGIADGKIYSAVIAADAYAGYFNRYGTSVFFA